jgi:hypothetical protein
MRTDLLKSLGRGLGAFALILAASAAVVWPIWALATKARPAFNAAALALLLAAIAWLVVSRRRRAKRPGRARGRGPQ